MAATGFVVNPSLYDKVYYDPIEGFRAGRRGRHLSGHLHGAPGHRRQHAAGADRLREGEPGTLNYSTPGAGTLPHLAAELLKLNTGIDMVHVPYPGAAPAAQALLLGKTVEVASTSITVAKPQIDAGTLIGLAVTGSERWPELPDVPTVGEAGVPRRSPIPGRASWFRPARRRRSSTGSPRR